MDLKKQKEHFKNHVATFTDYGNIKILDFKAPGRSDYRIRFLFEEDFYRLHISGDLGELTASNYNNMTYEKFSDFTNSIGYFEGKIDCHSRPIYVYDEEKARKDLKKLIKDCGDAEKILETHDWNDTEEDAIEEVIDDIMADFDETGGIGSAGYDEASNYIPDFSEYSRSIGKENNGILERYMLAFKLAQKQINESVDE